MSNKTIDFILGCCCFALLLGAYVYVSDQDAKDEEASIEHYCFMVKSYKNSKGAMGWPDFENIYEEECK